MPAEAGAADPGAEAARLALKIGSAVGDFALFTACLTEEFPLIGPALKTLKRIGDIEGALRSNRFELARLHERSCYLIACFVVKRSRSDLHAEEETDDVGSSRHLEELSSRQLEEFLGEVRELFERCVPPRPCWRMINALRDRRDIASLHGRVGDLTMEMGLGGIFAVDERVGNLKERLEGIVATQESRHTELVGILKNVLTRMEERSSESVPALAEVPVGTPAGKSWHVKRVRVMEEAFVALSGGRGSLPLPPASSGQGDRAEGAAPRLVGLVGPSGSGKTTAASEIIRGAEARSFFCDGTVWLSVDDGAKDRLPSLMYQLAKIVHEYVGESVGRPPAPGEDGAGYVRERMRQGRGRSLGRAPGLRCLLVADNVWDVEVVSRLRETGMWVLLTTRNEALLGEGRGETVRIDELSKKDAEAVLRAASELPEGVALPDAAMDLLELCDRVAMDLSFVGRWTIVRGREDAAAWRKAAGLIREELSAESRENPDNSERSPFGALDLQKGNGKGDADTDDDALRGARRRMAILRAGFHDLGTEDLRVQRLYLALAVLPDGHAFATRDAAVLLYGVACTGEDERAAGGVVETLERWDILRPAGDKYRLHESHSGFARQKVVEHELVRRQAVERWTKLLSSLDSVRSIEPYALKGLWSAVDLIGGGAAGAGAGEEALGRPCPYQAALEELAEAGRSETGGAGADAGTATGASQPPPPPPLLLYRECLSAVARFRRAKGDWKGAHDAFQRQLEVERATLAEGHPFVVDTLSALAESSEKLGLSEEARELRRLEEETLLLARNKAVYEAAWGEDARSTAHGLMSLALTMMRRRDPDEARRLLQRALRLQEGSAGPGSVGASYALHALGVCECEAGRLKEGEEALRKALQVKAAKLGPDHSEMATTLHELGVCLRKAGRIRDAEGPLRRALEIREGRIGSDGIEAARTLRELGICARTAGRIAEAEGFLRRALSVEGGRD